MYHYLTLFLVSGTSVKIPRGQGLQGEGGLYEDVEDTRKGSLPPLFHTVCGILIDPALPRENLDGYSCLTGI